MKLETIVGSLDAVNALLAIKLPVSLSYKLSAFINKLQPELEAYNKARKELVESLGVPVKDKEGKET